MRTYGEQNLSWQGLRDGARGQARFWPDGRVNVVYPYGFGARDIPTFTERYPEWVWRYYLATGDRTTASVLYPHDGPHRRLPVGGASGRHGSALRARRRPRG